MHDVYADTIADGVQDPAVTFEALGVLATLGVLAEETGDEIEVEALDPTARPSLALLVSLGYLDHPDGNRDYVIGASRYYEQ